jgi:hypothetical protein
MRLPGPNFPKALALGGEALGGAHACTCGVVPWPCLEVKVSLDSIRLVGMGTMCRLACGSCAMLRTLIRIGLCSGRGRRLRTTMHRDTRTIRSSSRVGFDNSNLDNVWESGK